jgi:hypothetical protein
MLGVFAGTPVLAYGAENYQVGFAGTAVAPGTGFGFGFWGWCAFGGGSFTSGVATSGTTGDCQFAEYIHTSSGGVTCHQSGDITSWTTIDISPTLGIPTFFVTGTATVNPPGAAACLAIPGAFPPSFTNFDTLIPAAPGHYRLNGALGLTGELQIQVTAIPS